MRQFLMNFSLRLHALCALPVYPALEDQNQTVRQTIRDQQD